MPPPSKTQYPLINYGSLPVEKINHVMDTELEPGNVRLSARAHKHIAEDHPDDYAICIAAMTDAIANPSFIGQAPKSTENFEIIKRVKVPEDKEVLVAIRLEPGKDGYYSIVSSYLIDKKKVDTRRIAGRIRPPPP